LSAQPDRRDDGRGNHQNPCFPSFFHSLSIGETKANIKLARKSETLLVLLVGVL
jgi:hypothetical protein